MLLICLFITTQLTFAQNRVRPEYQVKAAFLLNFTRFVDWPTATFSSPNAPFVIGVIGHNPFGVFMEKLVKGENVQGHPIIIQRYRSPKEILNSHILFVSDTESLPVKEIISRATDNSILTVSDAKNFVQMGGIVRFYKESNKIKLEINITSADEAKLDISSKLLSVASIFDSEEN